MEKNLLKKFGSIPCMLFAIVSIFFSVESCGGSDYTDQQIRVNTPLPPVESIDAVHFDEIVSSIKKGETAQLQGRINKGEISVNIKNKANNSNVLHELSSVDNGIVIFKIFKLLKNNGVNIDEMVNDKDKNGETPLSKAILSKNKCLIGKLLSNGADPNAIRKDGYTMLQIAVGQGKDIVIDLIDKGADVNAVGKWSGTALHVAANNGYEEIVDILIMSEINVDTQDKYGNTALHYAANKGFKGIVEILIKSKASLNVKGGKDCSTALHYAVSGGHQEIVEILIKAGADGSIKNKNELTALDLLPVNHAHHQKITDLLKPNNG